jgi:4-amino-4-deoxychorismate lyase
MQVYLNGKFVDIKSAKIPVIDKGILYGYGVFETIKSYSSFLFLFDRHYKRLVKSLKEFRIDFSFSQEKIKKVILELLDRNSIKKEGYIRITVTGDSNIFIIARKYKPLPKSYYEEGIKLKISEFRRNRFSVLPYHKTLSYLENIFSKRQAEKNGYFETIFFDCQGKLAEGCISNIFLVKDKNLLTPSVDCAILPGITREFVISIARKIGIKVIESKNINRNQLLSADEVFITNSMIEILPVSEIENIRIGRKTPGDITKTLISEYKKEIFLEARYAKDN